MARSSSGPGRYPLKVEIAGSNPARVTHVSLGAGRNVQLIRRVFDAIERRDAQLFAGLCHPDVELHWPASLPYGGVFRGVEAQGSNWTDTWVPLQPTDATRRMDPRVVAATDAEVVVVWHQRGLTASGESLDQPVLGLYEVRDEKLFRAQMFYFDTTEVVQFLAASSRGEHGSD